MRALLLVTLLGACASPPPYSCSTPTDPTGHGIALCHDPHQTPVCDAPPMHAHYVATPMGGYVLSGGTTANCDSSNQAVCPDRTISPRCITQPAGP